jgi:hypothetical protein
MIETRKQKERRRAEVIATAGFERGFEEGSKYMLSLLMGMPRPSSVVLDDEMEPGSVAILVNPATDLQRERIERLGEILSLIRSSDAEAALSGELELSPVRRLERIVGSLQASVRVMERGDRKRFSREDVEGLIENTISLARGIRPPA